MKKIFGVVILCAAMSVASVANAQDTTEHRSTVGKVGHGIKKGGQKKPGKGQKKELRQ